MPKRKRDVGQTPWGASLAPSSGAVSPEDTGFSRRRGDTAHILKVEGTPKGKYRNGIISRVAVFAPDGEALMPTKPSRARRWIESGQAKPVRTKLGIFAVQLTREPSGKTKQPIVVGIDPGSKYTGVAVVSKRAILAGFNLELPDYIKERMGKRRERRRNRRSRKCRRRKCRFLNRTGHKIAPSILARKQLELRVVKELAKTYPISKIVMEDVAFDHRNLRYGSYFSQVEIGKNWLTSELGRIAPVKLFKSWQTQIRRKELGLKKSSRKGERNPESHVNDTIALSSLELGTIEQTPFYFDIVRRPRYSRRKLHLEQPSGGGIRRQYGGTTTPFSFRKGDYVEVKQGNKTIRGWVSGYTGKLISVSNFNWKRLGQFAASKVRLLERNSGLMLKTKDIAFLPILTDGVSCEV